MTDQPLEATAEETSVPGAPGKPARWLWIGAGLTAGLAAARVVARRGEVVPALYERAAIERLLIERHGRIQGGKLLAEAEHIYTTLAQAEEKPAHRALQAHLYQNILTGLALYRAQLEAGINPAQAQEAVAAWITAIVQPMRRQVAGLTSLPGGFTLLRMLTPLVMRSSYPTEGWAMEHAQYTRDEIAFDLTSCYYLDTLTRLGAPELTPLYCAGDDLVYGALAKVAWGRSKTLARGGDCCDFRWCKHPTTDSAAEDQPETA